MRFAKGHGTGNDFVILPDPDGEVALTPEWVAALCDRRRGIGGDGVLRVVRVAREPDAAAWAGSAEWFMDYRNSDGSLATMCGNGVRVYARYLVDSGLAGPVLPVATRYGVVVTRVTPDAVTAAMSPPVIGGTSTARVGAREFTGTAVTVGNPNLVCPVADVSELEALDLRDAPVLDPATFPGYANTEFVSPAPPGSAPVPGADLHVRMRVFERGAGETLSCGSGACGVAAVALRDAGRGSGTIAVDVPGGRLLVALDAATGACELTGPAVIVATGDLLAPLPGAPPVP